MKVKKVLCPIDFSPGSDRAMQAAVRIATEADAELVLLHAWQIPVATGDYAFAAGVTADIEEAARECLDAAATKAAALGAKRLSSRLETGAAWNRIVDVLADPSFDLVVMGTLGRTGIRRFLLGSVAEKVVRHAPCPVLTIHPEGELRPFTNVLVPVDFSASSRDAMDAAASLVRAGGAGITLLHVVELPVNYSGEPKIDGLMDALDRRGTELIEQWAADLRKNVDVPVRTRSRIGRANVEALKVLDEDGTFDLVVTGSHGRTGIGRAFLGSVAEQIVRHAPCPVLVHRRR